MTCKHADHLLCRACLAARWGVSPQTVSDRRAKGALPKPSINADLASGHLWHVDTVDRFERGESVPMWWPASARPNLRAVAS